MIGMESVKSSVFYQVIYYLQNLHSRSEGDYLHTIITGNPGCGKTSVAKIIGKIYQNLGILSRHGKFKVATRPDFVAEYLGQSAIKTKKLLTSCLGGVLFVDEIYALGNQEKRDSFSKEAIDTINVFLSEHKNDFCFIGAGYKDEIDKCFFAYNQGLSRRFQWQHNIEGYTPDNLADILFKMVKEINWDINVSKIDIVSIITSNKELLPDSGGSMETLLSKIKLTHSKRVFGKDKELKFIITIQDIKDAIDMIKKFSKKKERNISVEMMYV
jgi:Holliday junction resolvasome RuvABC ATP-dependent DNA helicase subunit